MKKKPIEYGLYDAKGIKKTTSTNALKSTRTCDANGALLASLATDATIENRPGHNIRMY